MTTSGHRPFDLSTVRDLLVPTLTILDESPRRIVATRDGRPVRIALTEGVVDWLVADAWICRQAGVDPIGTLTRNAELVFATVILSEGDYWLRVAVPLDSVELNDPVRVVLLAIDAARSMSPVRFVSMVGASDVFLHYAD